MPDNETTETVQQVPPEAFERVKRELAEAKEQAANFAREAKSALVIDKLYDHFSNREDLADRNHYALAREAATLGSVLDAEDPAKAADEWLNRTSALFQSKAPSGPPPAAGPNPGAEGIAVESGPFPVGGDEWKKFVEANGMPAAFKAMADGQFYTSRENQEAQGTAQLIR